MRKLHKQLAIIVLFIVSFLMSGCAQLVGSQTTTAQEKNVRILTDCTGTEIELPQKPRRIVSLTLATDEITLALVGPERMLALTDYADEEGLSNITTIAKAVPNRVGGDAEAILALKPDLVISPDWWRVETAMTLRQMGIPVYMYKTPNNISTVKESILAIAEAVNEPQKGKELIFNMDAVLEDVRQRTQTIAPEAKKTAIWYSMMVASGKGSHFEDICNYAHLNDGAALAGVKRGESLPKEALIRVNPDLLLMPNWTNKGKLDVAQVRREVENDPALQGVKAVQNHQLITVPDRYLYCISQYIVYGVRDIAQAAYPQLF